MTAVTEWLPLSFDSLNETQAICELLTGDPVHRRDREAIVAAIRECAENGDGTVDPNKVRPLIPAWVYPRCIGAVYGGLERRGVLTFAGWTTNEDAKGRNVGKHAKTYRWTETT